MTKIRCAVVGVGNCFSGLVQGIEYYRKHPEQKVIGIMHQVMGGYSIFDLEFVAAFDVDSKKVGTSLDKAVFSEPNKVHWVEFLSSMQDVMVRQSPRLDGVGSYVQKVVNPVADRPIAELRGEILEELKGKKVEILVSYLPVGSDNATKFWAQVCLDGKIGFVNCMPSFIASEPEWAKKFEQAGIPIIGDDIKGQVGATIVHRTLAHLCDERGTKIEKTYQINVGGNSVTGDQIILLKHNGKIIKTKIGEYVDELVSIYGEQRTDGKEVVDIAKTNLTIECMTTNEKNQTVLSPVSGLIRHKIKQDLYEVETFEGRKITVTKDHNLFTLNDSGDLKTVTAGNLKQNETFIAVPNELHLNETTELTEVDLSPYLKDLFARGIDQHGNIIVHNHPEIKIPLIFPISDSLLQRVGLWLADGNYDKVGSANIEIAYGNDPECLQALEDFIEPYEINYKINGQRQVSVRIMSKTLAKIFKLALGLTGNSYTKSVPTWIFGLSRRQIGQILRGYLSGDGTVTGKQIRWTTASTDLAHDIQTLFLLKGIKSSIIRENYVDKNHGYKTSLEFINHGVISSKEDVCRFIDDIGFIQASKNSRAKFALEKLVKGNTRVVPKCALVKKWGIVSTSWDKFPTFKLYTILNQLDKVKDDADLEKIRQIYFSGLDYLRIKSIKKIPATRQYVYDLSVPNYERFICSNILVHNTDFLSMKEQERLQSKKISKTESVQSQLSQRLPDQNIYVGPSDFIPFLSNTKLMFMRIEGRMWANIPYNMEVRLEVDDKANSAGIVIDAIRYCKIALDRKLGGPLLGPSAWLMKHPPKQFTDSEAKAMAEDFVR